MINTEFRPIHDSQLRIIANKAESHKSNFFEIQRQRFSLKYANFISLKLNKEVIIQLLFQQGKISLDDSLETKKYIKISRSQYTGLANSYIVVALGQKRNEQQQPLFFKNNTPNYNLRIYSVIHGKLGLLGKGSIKIVKYLLDEKTDEKLAKAKFIKNPEQGKCRFHMQAALKKVEGLPCVNGGTYDVLYSFSKDRPYPILISEYAESDLERTIKGFLNKMTKIKYALGILQGLARIHEIGIVHRDIKPSNIHIINDISHLSDFDFATMVWDPDEFPGTPLYAAPEVIGRTCNSFNDLKKADVYQTGVTLYELFNKKHPWNKEEDLEESNQFYHELPEMTKERFEILFPQPKKKTIEYLIWQMKHIDPNLRPSAKEALQRLLVLSRKTSNN